MTTMSTREQIADGGVRGKFKLKCPTCDRTYCALLIPEGQHTVMYDMMPNQIVPCHSELCVEADDAETPFEVVTRMLEGKPKPPVGKFRYQIMTMDNFVTGFSVERL